MLINLFKGKKKSLFLLGISSFLVMGCTATINDFKTPVTLTDNFSNTGSLALTNKWWLAFKDPALNALIEQALHHNFNLLAAHDRLAQARAIAKKSGTELIPQLNGSFAYNKRIIENKSNQNTIN